jgi:DNA-binding SARP family transcriptional activator
MRLFRASRIERIDTLAPRLLRIVAGAGWGKSTFARAIAARRQSSVICDCADTASVDDFWQNVRVALNLEEGDPLTAWRRPGAPAVFIIDDAHELVDVEHGVDALRTLLRNAPRDRMVIICSRRELPLEWSRYAAPHETLALGEPELAFDDSDVAELFAGYGLDPAVIERAKTVSGGWPVAMLLFERFAREGMLSEALERLSDAATFGDLHDYIATEVLRSMAPEELDAFVADVALDGDVTPVLAAAVHRFYPERVASVRVAASAFARKHGDFVRAAELALEGGDQEAAVAALDDAVEPVAGAKVSIAYLTVAMRLDIRSILRSRNVMTVLFSCRPSAAAGYNLFQKIDAAWNDLQRDPDPEIRHAARIARGKSLVLVTRFLDAEAVLVEAELDERARATPSSHAALLWASLANVAAGRLKIPEAYGYWERVSPSGNVRDTFFVSERAAVEIAAMFVNSDRERVDALVEDIIDASRDETYPIVTAMLLTMRGMAEFVSAGRMRPETVERISVSAHAQSDADPLVVARYAEPSRGRKNFPTRFNITARLDAALDQPEDDAARSLCRLAIRDADLTGATFFQILARVVAAGLSPHDRDENLEDALDLAPQGSPLYASLEALRDDRLEDAGLFAAVSKRAAERHSLSSAARIHVEVMRARVARGGTQLRLRDRELELLLALALSPRALSRDELLAYMWPDQSTNTAGAALRTTVHRLRAQLGRPDSIIYTPPGYHLGDSVSVDVREAESLINALRDVVLGPSERQGLSRLLDSLAGEVPPLYQQWSWFVGKEPRLIEIRRALAILLAEDDFRAGRYDDAATISARILEIDPLDEPIAELMVRALVAGGEANEAKRRVRLYADRLSREYDTEPSYDLWRLLHEGALALN